MSKRTFRAENAAGPVLVAVALAGTVLSFMGIYRLALHSGWSPWAAWLLPLALDGATVAGVLQVLQSTAAGTSRRYGWWLTAGGALVSVAANAVTSTPDILAAVDQNWLAAVTHALPVVTVVVTLEAWLFQKRSSIHKAAQDAATASREDVLLVQLTESASSVAAGVMETTRLQTLVAKLEESAKLNASATSPVATPRASTADVKALTAVPDLAATASDKADREARILELRADGLTVSAAATEVGISLSSAKRILSAAKTSAA